MPAQMSTVLTSVQQSRAEWPRAYALAQLVVSMLRLKLSDGLDGGVCVIENLTPSRKAALDYFVPLAILAAVAVLLLAAKLARNLKVVRSLDLCSRRCAKMPAKRNTRMSESRSAWSDSEDSDSEATSRLAHARSPVSILGSVVLDRQILSVIILDGNYHWSSSAACYLQPLFYWYHGWL